MRSSKERHEALVEEVKTLLRNQGKTLDPEVLARLTAAHNGVVEGSASRFATIWRAIRVPVSLLLAALFALLIFLLMAR